MIYSVGNSLVLNKGRRSGVSREIDCCSVNSQQAITAKKSVVRAIGVEIVKDRPEHSGVNLGTALTDSGRGDFDTRGI